jgi:hypothetical protein
MSRRRRAGARGAAALRSARGQASLMMLAVVGALLLGTLVLFAFGNAPRARGRGSNPRRPRRNHTGALLLRVWLRVPRQAVG